MPSKSPTRCGPQIVFPRAVSTVSWKAEIAGSCRRSFGRFVTGRLIEFRRAGVLVLEKGLPAVPTDLDHNVVRGAGDFLLDAGRAGVGVFFRRVPECF